MEDQKQIWTSPAKLRFADADWLIPVSGIAAGLFVTDRDVSTHLSNDPKTISHYKTLSDAGIAALVGGAGAMWLLSYPAHREHWRETGYLAGEAAIDSLVAVEALKYSLRRERPYQGDGSGPFFSGGTSFPSEHAAAAWSVAGVIAHEYPGPLPKILAYGLASFVSYSRVRGRQHFPSDVFIGGLMGQIIAQDVYSRRHDPELGGAEWKPVRDFLHDDHISSSNQGSPYVPLDSWIYPALERLAGMGLIESGFMGMQPWTRSECSRLVNEAEDRAPDVAGDNEQMARLIERLQQEFQAERDAEITGGAGAFRLESAYSRTEHISGTPVRDGYHFAQTQINDFGRPYGEGWNTVNGFSAYATWGRWVGYVRGELQTAPGGPGLPLAARQTMASVDQLPPSMLPPGTPQPSVTQATLLDSYVGVMLSNWEISYGKQSLSWGQGEGGAMMFSDDAEPINMFRINRVIPFKLPSILGWLGPIRTEVFLGQFAGHQLVLSPQGLVGEFGQSLNPQPFINGQKFNFKPTRNFEFGLSRTTIYGGPGYPLTTHTLLRSLFSTGNSGPGSADKPGDRRSGVDFSYRLPKMRDWLTFYGDGFTEDQYSPIGYPDRSVWHSGLFLSHVPFVSKLDFRVEGVYSDNPLGGKIGPGYFYSNDTWKDGYTNNGYLLGSWIGRAGQGAQAWTNYWFSDRNRVQFNFRHQKISQEYLPNGGSLTDVGVRGDYWLRSDFSVSAAVQYERWLSPVIQPNEARNVSATVEILFAPQKLFRRRDGNGVSSTLEEGDRP